MASSLQLKFLVLVLTAWNVNAFNRAFYRRTSLCERSAEQEGVVRQCMEGTGRSECPDGWKAYKPGNYLLCWAQKDVNCCEQDIEEPPKLNHPECGRLSPAPRIANGEDETKCQSPWQVSLRSRLDIASPLSLQNSLHVAGGVLVQSRWVLTTPLSALFAGQPVSGDIFNENLLAVAGDHRHLDIDGDEQERFVKNVYFHPNFVFPTTTDFVSVINDGFDIAADRVWQENAFALIELENDVEVNQCVIPACLPDVNEQRLPTSAQCKLTGWGSNEEDVLKDVLQKADMQIFDGDECSQFEGALNNTRPVPYPARTGCILNEQISYACVGDFGGPVVCQGSEARDRGIVEGLAVTRLDCNNGAIPTRIALVREAMDWIADTILNNS